jgi:dTDP-4-dehydrorhamnose reductase
VKSLLVLGSTGFLGRALVHELARVGRERHVLLASRTPQHDAGGGSGGQFEPIAVDGEMPGHVGALVEARAPRVVFLVAALARGGDCTREPQLAARLNTDLPGEVAAACARSGARLVHVSTDLVFGAAPPPPGGFREDDAPAPLDVYGATKAAGERAVLACDERALVARLPLLFGDSRGRGAGASDALLFDVRAGREIVLFDDEWRMPLCVDSAARALLALADLTSSGIVHLPGPERLTRAAFGLRVLANAGLSAARVRSAPRRALGCEHSRPADVSLAGDRARLLLGERWNVASPGRP